MKRRPTVLDRWINNPFDSDDESAGGPRHNVKPASVSGNKAKPEGIPPSNIDGKIQPYRIRAMDPPRIRSQGLLLSSTRAAAARAVASEIVPRYTAIKSPPPNRGAITNTPVAPTPIAPAPVVPTTVAAGSVDRATPIVPAAVAPAPVASDTALDDWSEFRVRMESGYQWWKLPEGIIDFRNFELDNPTAAEGTQLKNAIFRCRYLINKQIKENGQQDQFKVGMARLLGDRWRLYQSGGISRWRPSHLFIIGECRGREAVGFFEAALISLLAGNESWRPYNVNWDTNDRGGTGPRLQEWENARYLLYLAFGFVLGVQRP